METFFSGAESAPPREKVAREAICVGDVLNVNRVGQYNEPNFDP